jgi:hypothetical protein
MKQADDSAVERETNRNENGNGGVLVESFK